MVKISLLPYFKERKPDSQTESQIGHITDAWKWRRIFKEVRGKRGACTTSDHKLLVEVFKISLKSFNDPAPKVQYSVPQEQGDKTNF